MYIRELFTIHGKGSIDCNHSGADKGEQKLHSKHKYITNINTYTYPIQFYLTYKLRDGRKLAVQIQVTSTDIDICHTKEGKGADQRHINV